LKWKTNLLWDSCQFKQKPSETELACSWCWYRNQKNKNWNWNINNKDDQDIIFWGWKRKKKKVYWQQITPPPWRIATSKRGCGSTFNDTVKWYFWLLGGLHAPLKVCRHSHASTLRPHVTKLFLYIFSQISNYL